MSSPRISPGDHGFRAVYEYLPRGNAARTARSGIHRNGGLHLSESVMCLTVQPVPRALKFQPALATKPDRITLTVALFPTGVGRPWNAPGPSRYGKTPTRGPTAGTRRPARHRTQESACVHPVRRSGRTPRAVGSTSLLPPPTAHDERQPIPARRVRRAILRYVPRRRGLLRPSPCLRCARSGR